MTSYMDKWTARRIKFLDEVITLDIKQFKTQKEYADKVSKMYDNIMSGK